MADLDTGYTTPTTDSNDNTTLYKWIAGAILVALVVVVIVLLVDDDNGDKGICCIKPGNNLTSEECKNAPTSGQCNTLSGCTWAPSGICNIGKCCIKPGNNLTSEECKNAPTSGQCNQAPACIWAPSGIC